MLEELNVLLENAKKEENKEALSQLFQRIKELKINYEVLTPIIKIQLGIIEFKAKNILASKSLQ